MPRIKLVENQGTEVSRIWATAPGLGESLQPLLATMYDESKLELPTRVREAARMRIANHNACAVCLAHRAPGATGAGLTDEFYAHVMDPSHPEYSARESLAIQYAGVFATDHLSIDDKFFDQLRREFSDSELAELTILLGVWLGLGRVTRTLDVDNSCSLQPS